MLSSCSLLKTGAGTYRIEGTGTAAELKEAIFKDQNILEDQQRILLSDERILDEDVNDVGAEILLEMSMIGGAGRKKSQATKAAEKRAQARSQAAFNAIPADFGSALPEKH